MLGTANSTDIGAGAVPGKAGIVEVGNMPSEGLLPFTAAVPMLAPLREAAAGIGVINISPFDAATIVRRVPMAWNGPEGVLPTLAVEGLRIATGESTIVLVGSPDLDGFMTSIRLAGTDIPTTPDGQLWVRYRKNTPDLYVPAYRVLEEGLDPEVQAKIAGNIVFIGTSAAGLLDIRTTALGENVPGVSIHAQVLEQILQGDFLRRDGLVEALEILSFLVLGLIVVGVMSRAGPIASILTGSGVGVAGGGGKLARLPQQRYPVRRDISASGRVRRLCRAVGLSVRDRRPGQTDDPPLLRALRGPVGSQPDREHGPQAGTGWRIAAGHGHVQRHPRVHPAERDHVGAPSWSNC